MDRLCNCKRARFIVEALNHNQAYACPKVRTVVLPEGKKSDFDQRRQITKKVLTC